MKIFINPGHGGDGKFNAWYDASNLKRQIEHGKLFINIRVRDQRRRNQYRVVDTLRRIKP